MRHCHYIVQGYAQKTETGALTDSTTIDILATNEKEALDRARRLVKRDHYRVAQIVEHDPYVELATQAGSPIPTPNGETR